MRAQIADRPDGDDSDDQRDPKTFLIIEHKDLLATAAVLGAV